MSQEFFPLLNKKDIRGNTLVYFDNAATTQKPQSVLDLMMEVYSSYNANVYRGDYYWSEKTTNLYNEARQKVADFIGAKTSEEIIFTRNTTEGINLIAQILQRDYFKKGDEIIISLVEHHSNYLPWWQIAQTKKLKLKIIGLDKKGYFDLAQFKKSLSSKTKLVAIAGVSNVLGIINPISEIVQLSHKIGVLVLIDGAQWVAHLPINVKTLDCDFLAFSGHKMYGPTGIGVLYAKKDWLTKTEPFLLGGEMVNSFDGRAPCWASLPQKFEAGTPAYIEAIGLGRAIDMLNKTNFTTIQKKEKELLDTALQGLKSIKEITILGPQESSFRSGIIAFNLKGIHAHDLSALLADKGIMIRAGVHCAGPLHFALKVPASARISFGIYNTRTQVDYFLKVLKEINLSLNYGKK
jgi:cysteine desulfurase/selenocysteine lyase